MANFAPRGVIVPTTVQKHVLQSLEAQLAAVQEMFGEIPPELRHAIVDNQSRQFPDLTGVLMNYTQKVVPDQITGLLLDSYLSPYVNYLLPLRQLSPYESINVSWSTLDFQTGLADQVETQGIGRSFEYTKAEHGARAERRGLTIEMEAGIFDTPEGRELYRNRVRQVASIIQRTNEMDVMLTILGSQNHPYTEANALNGPTNRVFGRPVPSSFEKRVKLFNANFGIINKTPGSQGFENLVQNIRNEMGRSDRFPDSIILPPNLATRYYSKADKTTHWLAGDNINANKAAAEHINSDTPFLPNSIQGMRVIDTYIYRASRGPYDGNPQDLLTCSMQIGEYMPMVISDTHSTITDFEKFDRSSRDIMVFNEERDDIVPVTFQQCLKNSLRFDRNGDLIESDYHGFSNDPTLTDMFFPGPDATGPAKHWAEMRPEYLDADVLDAVVTTMRNALLTEDEFNSLMDYLSLDDGGAEGPKDGGKKAAAAPKTAQNKPKAAGTILERMINKLAATGSKSVCTGYTIAECVSTEVVELGNVILKDKVDCEDSKRNLDATWKTFSSRNAVDRALLLVFLTQEINSAAMSKMHGLNIFVPVDILLCRPSYQFACSSGHNRRPASPRMSARNKLTGRPAGRQTDKPIGSQLARARARARMPN